MPAYNGEKYIRQAIDSVLLSSMQDIELVVVDDGSTDKTSEILREYELKDDRVRVFKQPNSGRPAFPKNLALRHVRGEFVCFLDNDDYIAPEKLELMVNGLDDHPEWCATFHDIHLVNAEGVGLGKSYLQDAEFLSKSASWLNYLKDDWYDCGMEFYKFQSIFFAAFHTQSIMIARNRIPLENLYFNTGFRICEDTDLWIRIGMMGRVGYLNKVLSFYRQHETNFTRNTLVFSQDSVLFHEQNFQRVATHFTQQQLQKYKVKIANCWYQLGYLHSCSNNSRLATQAFLNGARWAHPLKVVIPIIKAWLRPMLRPSNDR
ncbi:putative glycosyltransferase EpsH [mine drainage metagenome]|uniref:Putative glycosyltransferase EpsH n=1 Tax=mine drainage metagenome TaxID=410659 RepID=A0A1J5SGU9_9ZZZZ